MSGVTPSISPSDTPMSTPRGPTESTQLLGTSSSALTRSMSRMGTIAIMRRQILIDDEDASLVLVLPRGKAHGGILDETTIVQNPLEEAQKIFTRPQNVRTTTQWEDSFAAFRKGPVTLKVYQETCRSILMEILMNAGLKGISFPSIDRDEIFLKLSLARRGKVIQQLAQRHQYKMPFKPEAYKDMQAVGAYKGGEPMKNAMGNPVPAYAEFEYELADRLAPFRDVDEIRLLEIRLDEWVSVPQLLQQQIVTKFFPAANFDTVTKLHGEWASMWRIPFLPNSQHDDDVRNYFGEEIAFFFRWFAFYAQMLMPLGILGLLCSITTIPFFNLNPDYARYLRIAFSFVLVAWASVYNQLFKNRDARAKQRWGMKDFDALSVERANYRSDLEGTWELWFFRNLASLVVVGTCVFFVVTVTVVEFYKKKGLESGNEMWETYGSLSTVVLIKVVSSSWTKVAPKLADLQNHRTWTRWNDSLTRILASVKLFVALFPFINLAFLKKYTSPTCKDTLGAAAWKIYSSAGLPEGIHLESFSRNSSEAQLGFLQGYHYTNSLGKQCIYGCYPVQCKTAEGGVANCITSCRAALEEELLMVYVTHVVSTVAFLLIPIMLTKISMWSEIAKVTDPDAPAEDAGTAAQDARDLGVESNTTSRKALLAHGDKTYSFMQFQAKCYEQAPYQYASWGGSQVEDFLELAVGFALLTCFGILVPEMAMIAFVAHVVEYRLLAYRMTNVTCRPTPRGAEGIGSWQTIFETISVLAVAINVGIAVFFINPMQSWGPLEQFAAFIVLEHAMLFIKASLASAIPDEPEDVQRIEDFNTRFKSKFVRRDPLDIPPEERCDMKALDVGLGN